MRVLFLSERYPPDIGGLSASSFRISRTLPALGFEVDVLAWSRHLPAGKLLEPSESTLNCAREASSSRNERVPNVFRLGMYRQWDMTMPMTLNVLDWLHERRPYDLVWGHYLSNAGFLAVWFAALKGLRSVVSARGNDLDREIFPPGDLSRLRWTIENAGLLAAVSRDLAYKIRVLSGREDIDVLPNAVDTEVFRRLPEGQNELRGELGIREDELVLGFTGELREKKGMQFLFDCLRKLRETRPVRLLVVGDLRAQQRPAVQLFSAEFPEDAQAMTITGHMTEPEAVCRYLNICDLYLQPSLMEGMPNSLLEAMAAERICIASDAGGIPEIIEHGKNAFMLKRAQLHNLADAVLETELLSRQEKEGISRAARQSVLDSFSPAQEKERLAALFSKLDSSSSYTASRASALRSNV